MSSGEAITNGLRPPALMFGTPIADLTMTETLALIDELVVAGRGRNTTHQISTVNVDFLVNAITDPDVASILQNADVCLADGMPVVWGARLLGMPIAERVAGSDLVPLLVERSQTTGHHVHVFGTMPEVAAAAKRLLLDRYPDAHFSIEPGPMIADVEQIDDAVLDAIVAVDADVLCVALGNPKQERFIRAHRDRLRTPVMIGIGGSLDMLVGKRRRAPRWVQRIGMEWVVRAAQEPRRLGRRYAHDIRVFGPAISRAWLDGRRRRAAPGLRVEVGDEVVNATVEGDTIAGLEAWSAAAARLRGGAPLHVATAAVQIRDHAAAQLIGLAQVARRAGAAITVDGSADLASALRGLNILNVTSSIAGERGARSQQRTE